MSMLQKIILVAILATSSGYLFAEYTDNNFKMPPQCTTTCTQIGNIQNCSTICSN